MARLLVGAETGGLAGRVLTPSKLGNAACKGSEQRGLARRCLTFPSKYANCTNLHRYYPHGVGRVGARDHVASGGRPVTTWTKSTTAYNTAMRYNRGLDRDHDYIACEQR